MPAKPDITQFRHGEEELRRLNRALRVSSRCHRRAIHTADETQLLGQVCDAVTQAGGYGMAWIGFVTQDHRQSVRGVAAAGPSGAEYLNPHGNTGEDRSQDLGLAEKCIRSGRTLVCRTHPAEAGFKNWRGSATEESYEAIIALPLRSQGDVIGVLMIYSVERDAFGAEEARVLEELAADLSFGIEVRRKQVDRAQAAAALVQTESEFRTVFDNANDGIIIFDLQGRIVEANNVVCSRLGYTLEELLHMRVSDIDPPRLKALVEECVHTVLEQGHALIEGINLCKDGTEIPVEINARLFDYRGAPAVLGVTRDIRERKQARAEADFQESVLRAIYEGSPDGILVVDHAGRIVSRNRKFLDMWRLSPDGPLSPSWHDGVSDEFTLRTVTASVRDSESFLRRVQALYNDPSADDHCEIELKDGRIIERHSTSLCGEGGQYLGRAWFFRDVSARKQIESTLKKAKEDAEAANRTKSEFLANMSHEIRTPMNGVVGMIELALEACSGPGQRDELLVAQGAAHSLLTILNDILDLSKIESGKLTIEEIDFDLEVSLREALDIFKTTAREKKLRLDFHFSPDCPGWVRSDPVRLRQVVINLVGNAVKFTAEGYVQVHVTAAHGLLRLEVRDSGIGITAGKLDSIFEAFTQADGSTTRLFGGSGLGLTITRRLVEMMGGRVWAESEEGRGSVFIVELPLMSRPAPVRNDVPVQDASPIPMGVRVLVAEDNPVNQKVISAMLRRQGCIVTLGTNGREAYECFLQAQFDLILMDIQMPELDGLEATRRIRRHEQLTDASARIPIVALTAHASQQQHDQCLCEGMDSVITKPVNRLALLRCMASMLMAAHQPRPEASSHLVR